MLPSYLVSFFTYEYLYEEDTGVDKGQIRKMSSPLALLLNTLRRL